VIMRAVHAPGGPGAPPAWGPGRKDAFGTAPTRESRVWFTISDGALSDVFHPTIDWPLLHQLRFLAAAPGTPPIDIAADAEHEVRWTEAGVPSFVVDSKHAELRLRTEYVTDPGRDALLISGNFDPELPDLRLFVLASLHVVPGSTGNDAQVLDLDPPVLLGRQGDRWVSLLGPFSPASVGFLNASDVYVDLHDNEGEMQWVFEEATGGNVAFGARLDIRGGSFQLALGFGGSAAEAEEVAREARRVGFAPAQRRFTEGWRRRLDLPRSFSQVSGDRGELARASAAVLLSLEDKETPGAFVAAPAAPWGETCHDGNHIYHLVWARDLCEMASVLALSGDRGAAVRALRYLASIQGEDGSWPQNSSIDGRAHWNTPELDETGYPVLLAWELARSGELEFDAWPMVRRALLKLLTTGPRTPFDRWEDAGGLSPSTIALDCGALLAGAELAAPTADADASTHLRLVADYWNERLEHWCFARPGGFYARLGDDPDAGVGPEAIIAMECLELVHRGLRHPDDPRITSSLAVADRYLKVETPRGPAWRRYAGDTYGERRDGSPWRGSGVGRAWPLLLGERARRDLALGHSQADAVRAFEAFAGPELLLPEQVWDDEPIPARNLEPGGPTGSARPLGWAHAEYLRLLAAIAAGPPEEAVRVPPPDPPLVWHHGHRITTLPPGRRVVLQLPEPADVLWTGDAWTSGHSVRTRPAGLGLHTATLPTDIMRAGAVMEWTAHYGHRWEGQNYRLTCAEPGD
jgi:glucoamylase